MHLLKPYISIQSICWLALWSAIGANAWYITNIFGGHRHAFIHGLRSMAPLIVLMISIKSLAPSQRENRATITLPEKLIWLYAIAYTAFGIGVEPWFPYSYWGFEYIATLAAVRFFIQNGDQLEELEILNKLSWAIAIGMLVILLFVARDVLFVESEFGLSGYTIHTRLPSVGGAYMSRSTGLARFAAIPAVLAFVSFWRIKGLYSWCLSISVFIGSALLVWFMQSRGAIIALGFTIVIIMMFWGKISRLVGIFLLVIGILFGNTLINAPTKQYLFKHFTRGLGWEGLKTGSGRDVIRAKIWEKISASPIIGYGPQADRRLLHMVNAQNAPLYAWFCGGVFGFIGYVGGMLATWILLLLIIIQGFPLNADQKDMFVKTAGIFTFFTIRSFPEITAAIFSVDLLVQLPAMIYISTLYVTLRQNTIADKKNELSTETRMVNGYIKNLS